MRPDESFSKRALEVLIEAARAAAEYGHGAIGPGHLLLGLAAVDGRALGVLLELGVDRERLRQEVQRLGRFPPRRTLQSWTSSLSHDDDAKRVLEIAQEEAAGAGRLETQHLLLALLRAGDRVAAQALANVSVRLADVGDRLRPTRQPPRRRTSASFERAFADLLRGLAVWRAVGDDRQRLIDACLAWLTPARVRSLDTSTEADRAAWILDRLLPLEEVDVFRRLNSHERWLYTLYPLFRRSPADMDTVTPERFRRGEREAVAAAWVDTRATNEELLGWHAECERRGWPDADCLSTLATVEYCRRARDAARLVAHLEVVPPRDLRVILLTLMRLVAGRLPATEAPVPGLEKRLRDAGLGAVASAVARHAKASLGGPGWFEVVFVPPRPPRNDDPELAEALWVEQQTLSDIDRLLARRSAFVPLRLARIVPDDRPDIWERAFREWRQDDEALVQAFSRWCPVAHRDLLLAHIEREDREWASPAFHRYLTLASDEEVARLAADGGRPAWQIAYLDRWRYAPPALRPPVHAARGPYEHTFDLREFDPFDPRPSA